MKAYVLFPVCCNSLATYVVVNMYKFLELSDTEKKAIGIQLDTVWDYCPFCGEKIEG